MMRAFRKIFFTHPEDGPFVRVCVIPDAGLMIRKRGLGESRDVIFNLSDWMSGVPLLLSRDPQKHMDGLTWFYEAAGYSSVVPDWEHFYITSTAAEFLSDIHDLLLAED